VRYSLRKKVSILNAICTITRFLIFLLYWPWFNYFFLNNFLKHKISRIWLIQHGCSYCMYYLLAAVHILCLNPHLLWLSFMCLSTSVLLLSIALQLLSSSDWVSYVMKPGFRVSIMNVWISTNSSSCWGISFSHTW
jgi:hypothetical protein